jgi:hypothetical protein
MDNPWGPLGLGRFLMSLSPRLIRCRRPTPTPTRRRAALMPQYGQAHGFEMLDWDAGGSLLELLAHLLSQECEGKSGAPAML